MRWHMSILNKKYLLRLSEEYKIESGNMFGNAFSAYCLIQNKKSRIYLILCNDYTTSFDIGYILNRVSSLDKAYKNGSSYLCVMPLDNPTTELCTYCNGKSFVHFIFFDKHTNSLVYDKKIYYSGSKHIKQLIEIYQECFDNLT